MPTNVVMPQMGESVAEGTVVRWIKKIGDAVDRDEPLFEISTDKVDAEIPSPAAGVILDILVHEGETVPIDAVVAVLGDVGEKPAVPTQVAGEPRVSSPASVRDADSAAGPVAEPVVEASRAAAVPAVASVSEPQAEQSAEAQTADRRRQKSSPLVRRIAEEHDVDLTQLHGSGIGGRVTKHDILKYIDDRSHVPVAPAAGRWRGGCTSPAFQPGEAVDVQPMSVMRRKIAEHMIYSRRTSAHVHSVFEVDFTRVAAARQASKAEFEQAGVKLTYLLVHREGHRDALRAMPVVNASIDGDHIVYKRDVNLGFAVALDWGLIVPVLHKADERNLLGIASGIADVAARARAKQLKPEDVQGGTFTITNPGSFGTLFGMPIINQPQVAILAVGTIEKRVVVIDDMIAVRQRGYLTLGYDHRLVDGAVADEFMSHVKATLESWG